MRTGQAAPRRHKAPQAARKGPSNDATERGREKVANDEYLTQEEALALGEALGDLLQTPGWRLVETLLTRMQNHSAVQGIRSPDQSKDYVKGKLDFVDEFRGAIAGYVLSAREIAEKDERRGRPESRVVSAMVPGGIRSI